MSWKDKKEIESRKIVSLGGKVRTQLWICHMHSVGSIDYGILNECNFKVLQLLLLDHQSCFTILQPQKKQRLPLSVARPIMKKQKEREQKMVQEVRKSI